MQAKEAATCQSGAGLWRGLAGHKQGELSVWAPAPYLSSHASKRPGSGMAYVGMKVGM